MSLTSGLDPLPPLEAPQGAGPGTPTRRRLSVKGADPDANSAESQDLFGPRDCEGEVPDHLREFVMQPGDTFTPLVKGWVSTRQTICSFCHLVFCRQSQNVLALWCMGGSLFALCIAMQESRMNSHDRKQRRVASGRRPMTKTHPRSARRVWLMMMMMVVQYRVMIPTRHYRMVVLHGLLQGLVFHYRVMIPMLHSAHVGVDDNSLVVSDSGILACVCLLAPNMNRLTNLKVQTCM